MDEVIKLIKKEPIINDYGEKSYITTSKLVFGRSKSVGQKEFYEAMANGLNVEIRFEIADYLDYDDEKEAELNGKAYKVVRTYRTNGSCLELTLMRGVNDGTS